MNKPQRIILASASPRRRELLSRAGYRFEIIASDADESIPPGLTAREAAEHTARAKALAVASSLPAECLVVGADTMVVCDESIFGKPKDDADAAFMLHALSGRAHDVITGVCIAHGSRIETFSEATRVVFRSLDDAEIEDYIATGEPADKAGAYGIQGLGGKLVDHIEGDFDNVVGLPVTALATRLEACGFTPTA